MNWIENARVSAIFALVFLSVSASALSELSIGSLVWWSVNVYESLVLWCFPIFVMSSGAVLLSAPSHETASSFYNRRLSNLLVPTLFWTVVFISWRVTRSEFELGSTDYRALSLDLLAGRPYGHLWFLFALIGLYLFTPFLRVLVAQSSREALWLFSLLALGLAMLYSLTNLFKVGTSDLFFTLFLSYIPYYLLGYLISSSVSQLPKNFVLSVFIISVAVTAYSSYAVGSSLDLERIGYFYDYLSLSVVPMSLSAFMLFRQEKAASEQKQRWITTLAGFTFGVYLVHPIPMETFHLLGIKPELYWPVLTIPAVAMLTFGLSLSIVWVLKRTPLLNRVV